MDIGSFEEDVARRNTDDRTASERGHKIAGAPDARAACWQTGVQLLPTWRRRPCIHRCADNKPCPPHSISPMPASTRRRRDGSAHWRRRLAYFPWRRFSRADRRKRSFTLRSSPIPSGSNPAMSAECSEEEVSQLRAKLSPASTRPSPIAWHRAEASICHWQRQDAHQGAAPGAIRGRSTAPYRARSRRHNGH